MFQYKLGIVGCTNMSVALINGLFSKNVLRLQDILVYDSTPANTTEMHKNRIACARSYAEIASTCEYILLASSAQKANEDIAALASLLNTNHRIISSYPNLTIPYLKSVFKNRQLKIARVNTNLSTYPSGSIAMSVLCFPEQLPVESQFVLNLFKSVGEVMVMPEESFVAIRSLMGMGSVYVYLMAETLIETAMITGLTYDQAYKIVNQTFFAGSNMLKKANKPNKQLISNLTARGEGLPEAVGALEQNNKLAGLVSESLFACYNKNKDALKR